MQQDLAFYHEKHVIYFFQVVFYNENQNCILCVLVEITPKTEELSWRRNDGVLNWNTQHE